VFPKAQNLEEVGDLRATVRYVVVARDYQETYEMFRGHFEDRDVPVFWDRRFAERRHGTSRISGDRRRWERRRDPPRSWFESGFVMVE
jgi:hypothetical protein